MAKNRSAEDAWKIKQDVSAPNRPKKIMKVNATISIPLDILTATDEYAASQGTSRSQLIADALKQYIGYQS